jgi:purine-nucleoside phosphorylase
MSIHISAKPGQIAPLALLPGDPMRAKFIAENFLENAVCHNEVRGMYGFTGTWRGVPVSVQGTGMGVPSISIYVHELINTYNVQTLIRIGSCGALREDIHLRDVILAQGASTDSAINKLRFGGMDYAPLANFDLLQKAHNAAFEAGIRVKTGNILTSDTFYHDDQPNPYALWRKYGVLAVEMEAAALYTLAAGFGRKALAIVTVSDHLLTGEKLSPSEREQSFGDMVRLALEAGTG